ncbi:HD-GYP domain-containing protein [Bacillus rubiinfantis]|uniref:HD-GYP domain-containing protein n=1 Tax=Bacillus rubiinfantis TaxID=1499680 RepID=UPI0006936881|nr:HD-GYP domain-containing protein [Bacillus rubiinfantis]
MNKIMKDWIKNPHYFRYGFYIILILIIPMYFLPFIPEPFYLFFLIATVFFGIGYYKKSISYLCLITTLIVILRILLERSQWNLPAIVLLEFTYLLIMYISVGIMRQAQKIKADNLELLLALSKALDLRDPYTSSHSIKVAKYAVEIAKGLDLSEQEIEAIYQGGLLHDIGKIGIPEHVLLKPGQLTNEEYNIIKKHPVIGYDMIKHVSDFSEKGILEIVLYHHERYDGKGYPHGLKGEQIPLGARILAIADTFDAMTSRRVYRNEIDLKQTLQEIQNNKGLQFDPEITDVFLAMYKADNSSNQEVIQEALLKGDVI